MQYEIWFVVDLKTDTHNANDTDDKEWYHRIIQVSRFLTIQTTFFYDLRQTK